MKKTMVGKKITFKEIESEITNNFESGQEKNFPLDMVLLNDSGSWITNFKRKKVGVLENKRNLYSEILPVDLDAAGVDKMYAIKVEKQDETPNGDIIYVATIEKQIEDYEDMYVNKGIFEITKFKKDKLQYNSNGKGKISLNDKLFINRIEGNKIILQSKYDTVGYIDTEKCNDYEFNIINTLLSKVKKENIYFEVISEFPLRAYVDTIKVTDENNELMSFIEMVVDKQIIDKMEALDILNYLKKSEIPDKEIIKIFATMKIYPDKEKAMIPDKPAREFIEQSGRELYKSIVSINKEYNLLLEGHMSTGKNVLCETLAWIYQRPLFEFSLNSEAGNFELLGTKTIENGDIKFEESLIIEGFRKGGIIVFDELNTALPQVMSIFNSMLDHRKRITVPGQSDKKPIKGDRNSVIIATQNPDYIGTQDLNQATRSRFTVVPMSKVEKVSKIIDENIDQKLSSEDEEKINGFYNNITAMVEEGEVSESILNLRGLIRAVQVYVDDSYSLGDAIIGFMVENLSDIDEKKTVVDLVNTMF